MTTTDLSRFISSDGDIFVVSGLPEEVIAVLFAKYSRSSGGLRETLGGMLKGEEVGVGESGDGDGLRLTLANEKARAFHEKWVVGYGHGSVAENAIIHMGIEGCSILAAKAIEDSRIGASFVEKSTRFVTFGAGSYATPPELMGEGVRRVRKEYEVACTKLIERYIELVNMVDHELRVRHPKQENMKVRAYDDMVRTRALDLCRGLLPAGTRTNLGLTINARAMELLLTKLYSHPAGEMREMATPMHLESKKVAPTLVKYAAPSQWRESLRRPMATSLPAGQVHNQYMGYMSARDKTASLRADIIGDEALGRVAELILWDSDGPAAAGNSYHTPKDELQKIVDLAMAARARHDRAPRAFETIPLTIDMVLDFGCFRDLQRHRMITWSGRELTTELGFDVPDGLRNLSPACADIYIKTMEEVDGVWKVVAGEVGEWAAQYVVPLGYNYHVHASANLRELVHLIELRSGKGGHESYRKIAQELHRRIEWTWPWAAKHVRCDHNQYEFARE